MKRRGAIPDALEYLNKRGLNNPELIDHFKLGVANRALANRLPEKNRKAGAEIQALGILRKGTAGRGAVLAS